MCVCVCVFGKIEYSMCSKYSSQLDNELICSRLYEGTLSPNSPIVILVRQPYVLNSQNAISISVGHASENVMRMAFLAFFNSPDQDGPYKQGIELNL